MNDAKRRFPHAATVPARDTRAALGPGASLQVGEWRIGIASAPSPAANLPWPTGLYARRLARAR